MTGLSAQDRHEIDMARQLAALATVATVREHVGTDDTVIALAHFWGAARVSLDSVAAVAERLGGTEDRCLREIRDLFSRFDWEHDDRQYALEAIERIVNEGGTDGD